MKKLLAISLIVFTPAVFANKVKVLEVTAPVGFDSAPVIRVYSSDGESWDSVDRSKPTTLRVGLTAECRAGIKRNRQPYRGALRVPGYERVGPTLPADAMIPETDSTYAQFRYADGVGQSHSVTKSCNDELQRRLARHPDKSKYQVMAEGFDLQVPAAISVEYALTCLATGLGGTDIESVSVAVNSRIECTASDLAAAYVPAAQIQVSEIKLMPMVSAISLTATPAEYIGTCPTNLVFGAAITASRPGKISYRIVSGSGSNSTPQEMVFNQAGTLQVPEWERTITVDTLPDLPLTDIPVVVPTEAPDSNPELTGTTTGPSAAQAVFNAMETATTDMTAAANAGESLQTGIAPLSVDDKAASSTGEFSATSITGSEPTSSNSEQHRSVTDQPLAGAGQPTAVQFDDATQAGDSASLSATAGDSATEPQNISEVDWDFVGWEQIEILKPEQQFGAQTRFAVACDN